MPTSALKGRQRGVTTAMQMILISPVIYNDADLLLIFLSAPLSLKDMLFLLIHNLL